MSKRCRRCHQRIHPLPPLLKILSRETQVTGSGTWTVPPDVTRLRIRAWGGGSSGRSLKALVVPSGGSGGLVEVELFVIPGQQIYYNIGTGGKGTNSVNPGQETSVSFPATPTTPIIVIIAFGGHVESSAGGTIYPQNAQSIIQGQIYTGRGGKGGQGGQLGLPGGDGADGGLIFQW